MKVIIVLILCLTQSLSAFPVSSSNDQKNDVQALFQQGKYLTESNCGECIGATRQGLQEGINKLIKVLESGYEDQLVVYELLIDAYNTDMVVYTKYGTNERDEAVKKLKELFEKALELNPDNLALRHRYINIPRFFSKDKAYDELQKILDSDPNYWPTLRVLGIMLMNEGKQEEAVRYLKRAFEHAPVEMSKEIADTLIAQLRLLRRDQEAKNIEHELHRRLEENHQRFLELELEREKQREEAKKPNKEGDGMERPEQNSESGK